MLVSWGIADVNSWNQSTQGVGAVARKAAATGPMRYFRTALWGLALVTMASAAAIAHESALDENRASIEATVHGGAAVAIEATAPAAAIATTAAIPAPVAEPAKTLDLSPYAPGTIVVQTSERKLHLVLGRGEVVTYPVGVGKAGKAWSGTAYIRGKYIRPAWAPPKALKREKPNTPDYIPGGVPSNPMGAAAMTLSVDQYAIHGTNAPSSIGTFASFGCIRMHNRDVLDLYQRVRVGTKVVVLN
jgi:lipoprotein-anchoring transpeptidase ErfK/SrfK